MILFVLGSLVEYEQCPDLLPGGGRVVADLVHHPADQGIPRRNDRTKQCFGSGSALRKAARIRFCMERCGSGLFLILRAGFRSRVTYLAGAGAVTLVRLQFQF